MYFSLQERYNFNYFSDLKYLVQLLIFEYLFNLLKIQSYICDP